MNEHLEILGDEELVLYKHLNKQYSTQKRLILTKDIILDSFEAEDMKDLFHQLMNSPPDQYNSIVQTAKEQGTFNGVLKNDLYKHIQERLSKISENFNIQLKDYNFMNSISNTKFDVVLRCDKFSMRTYIQEKGTLLSAIRNLLQKYVEFSGNVYRLTRLEKFQIEILESEEIYKHIILKKEDNKLLLYSGFGFLKNESVDYSSGGEFYFSIGEDFNFYKNKQQLALVKENTKIVEREIHPQEKVLSNEELMHINKHTKLLTDVCIEGFLTKKGTFRISHVSLADSISTFNSPDGFAIHKSSKNYTNISLVTIKDQFPQDSANPLYLIIKSDNELKTLMQDLKLFRVIDGIIFTHNIYNPFIERVCEYFDIDAIYYDKPLQKTLQTTLSWSPLHIDAQQQSQDQNPFASIIQEERKEKDELLERLKNIDLSTPKRTSQSQQENKRIQDMAEGLISSPGSSTANRNSGVGWPSARSSPGEKKTAMQILADSALNKEKPQPEQSQPPQTVAEQNTFQPSTQEQSQRTERHQSEFIMEDVHKSDLQPLTQETLENTAQKIQEASTHHKQLSSNVLSKYEDILATTILTPPSVMSSAYLADANTISQIQNNGKIFFVATRVDENKNSSLNYVVPITIEDQIIRADYLLINRLEDFFLINDSKVEGKKFIINLTQISSDMKQRAIKEGINKFKTISVIIQKQDLSQVLDSIDKIDMIHIKDLSSQEELEIIEKEILKAEKKHLMRHF